MLLTHGPEHRAHSRRFGAGNFAQAVRAYGSTNEAIGDKHDWVAQRYCFWIA
jgi:hypothetical protein